MNRREFLKSIIAGGVLLTVPLKPGYSDEGWGEILVGDGLTDPNTFTLIIEGGADTINWPENTRWASGIPPSIEQESETIIGFTTNDQGETWNGQILATGLNK
jgi:hypothetical protein